MKLVNVALIICMFIGGFAVILAFILNPWKINRRFVGIDPNVFVRMSALRASADMYYYSKKTYVGFCKSRDAIPLLEDAARVAGQSDTYVCNDSKDQWAAVVPIKWGYMCADDSPQEPPMTLSRSIGAKVTCNGF